MLRYTLYQAVGVREKKDQTVFKTPCEVHDHESFIKAVKWEYSPVKLINNKRKTENFECADVVVMDIDNEHTDDPQKWVYPQDLEKLFPGVCCYWDTSRNHMKSKKGKTPRPKFHAYFPLGCVYSDCAEYRALKDAIYNCYPDLFDDQDLPAVQYKFVAKAPETGVIEGSKTIIDYLNESYPQWGEQSKKEQETSLESVKELETHKQGDKEPKKDQPFIYNESYFQYCLDYIDPALLDRNKWLAVLMALKAEGMPYEMAYKWCMRDAERAINVEAEWISCRTDLPNGKHYTGATLTAMAIESVGEEKFYLLMPETCVSKPDLNEMFENLDSSKEKEFTLQELKKLSGNKLNKLSVPTLGNALIKPLNAVNLKGEGLYIYDPKEGYINDQETIEMKILSLFGNKLTPQKRRGIYDHLRHAAPRKKEAPKELILFNNCVLNTKTWEIQERTPEIFIKNNVPWNYNPNAAPVEIVDRVLNDWACNDPEVVLQMLECAGYCLLRHTPIHKFFLLIGPKGNGKSTFCDWIISLVGENNAAAVAMNDLSKRFQTSFFYTKLVNIGDENKGGFMPENPILKSVAAGKSIPIEPKGQKGFLCYCATKLIFCFNEAFRIQDTTGSFERRMQVILFNADVLDESKYDESLGSKLEEPEAMEYFLFLCVEALKGVLKRGRFTVPSEARKWMEQQNKINNSLLGFLDDCENEVELLAPAYGSETAIKLGKDFLTSNTFDEIYSHYKEWCSEKGVYPKGAALFSKEICDLKKLETYRKPVNGRKCTLFRYQIEKDPMYS